MSFRNGFALGLGILFVVVAGAIGFRTAFIKNTGAIRHSLSPADNSFPNLLNRNFEALSAQVQGALVNINARPDEAANSRNPYGELFEGPGAFELFNGGRKSGRSSLGSGFLVNPDGYIVTNSQVVENASRISVKLNDRRTMEAVVVGTDSKTDLAILKIRGANLPVLQLAKSDDVSVGNWVAAFGSSSGWEHTMTAGIISAKGRVMGPGSYDSLLQTDAAISPENSGGPLVNLQGEVVGVNIATASPDRGFNGIGFAIPAATVRRVYDQIIQSGRAARGWIGMLIQEVTPEIAAGFGLSERRGALVSEVVPEGPAAKAGLKSGDIILEFNRQQIRTSRDLSAAVANTKVGVSAGMKIVRNGKELLLDVAVGERPAAVADRFRSPQKNGPVRLGITVEDVTPGIQAQMNLSSSRGALVLEVDPGSFADNGGVRPGDVIHEINHSSVFAATDLLATMRSLKEDSTVLLRLERQGKVFYLAFQLS